ncbi:MAG: iron-sulfur cluster assembly accessory protein [Gemmatimonadetes bacterium]|nr:iron-sulfur cluster assembly accessory protein [Gemmatimonadota bacterium]
MTTDSNVPAPDAGAGTPLPIDLTPAAARAILKRAETDGKPGLPLRVRIQGGGCSGVTYKMDWDEAGPTEKDFVIERDGATVLVDPRSAVFLKGSTLDYKADLMQQRFIWNNPNAKSSCGCGESFSV